MLRWVAFATLVACENPSPLDGIDVRPPDMARARAQWEIGRRMPLDLSDRHLRLAGDPSWPEAQRIDELEAWAEGGGRLVALDPADAFEDGTGVMGTGLRIARDHSDDDRALEAALYLAQRLRRDRPLLVYAMTSAAITSEAARHRPHPPAFAGRYAPNDEEVLRAFDGEALFVFRLVRERQPGWETAPRWEWLADTPRDRAGFLAALDRHLGGQEIAESMRIYAQKMFTAVDEYQRWLAR